MVSVFSFNPRVGSASVGVLFRAEPGVFTYFCASQGSLRGVGRARLALRDRSEAARMIRLRCS